MKLLPMKVTALLPGFLKGGKTVTTPRGVSDTEVLGVQTKWAAAIAHISDVHAKGGDFVGAAADAAGELYAYGHGDVLFKPTKAAEYRAPRGTRSLAPSRRSRFARCLDASQRNTRASNSCVDSKLRDSRYQFRPTAGEAMSYFVGGSNVDGGYGEDGGFAINGGKGWASCVYDNHKITKCDDVAIAMGNYRFTCKTTGDVSKVEYTFGYKRCEDDEVRIFLHHSSVPYAA